MKLTAVLPTRTLLALLLCFKESWAVQTFQEEPSYTEVNPGESAVLSCRVYNMRGQCSWQKNGLPQGMFTGKYEWSGNRQSGDCSLRVLDVAEVDDGEWECQVTASTFTAQDALTSKIAKLVVRVAPDPPYLEVGHNQAVAGRNFTVREGRASAIKCIARYGNPGARFKWYIGSEELPPSTYNYSNSTEVDRPKLWRSVSMLHTSYVKADHGRQVRCVALHEAYDSKSLDVSVMLDVQYAPTVTLRGAPETDLEEGLDSVSLRCVADSNPPAKIIWRKLGKQDVFSFDNKVEFLPVSRKHSARYSCEANNAMGTSAPVSVSIDVKYPPFEIEVSPGSSITASLHNRTVLECNAGGNPRPNYTWLQRVDGSDRAKIRGHNATLVIDAVTYKDQGNYVCVASNVIKGNERRVQSNPVQVEVVGAPEVLRYSVSPEVQVERGQDALLRMVFCSDPQPRRANWEWGSNQLEIGNGNGRYVAETLSKVSVDSGPDDCYSARLLVQHADPTDARNYYFNVENDRGADRYAVSLAVREPMSMTVVIGVVVACLTLLVLVTLIVLYTFKTEKWCFAREGDFKPTDLESRSDLDNNKSPNHSDPQQTGTHSRSADKTCDRSLLYAAPEPGSASVGIASTNTSNTTINSISTNPVGQKLPFSPSEIHASKRSNRRLFDSAEIGRQSQIPAVSRSFESDETVCGVGARGRVDVATINVGSMNRYPNPTTPLESVGSHGSVLNYDTNQPSRPNGRGLSAAVGYGNGALGPAAVPVSYSSVQGNVGLASGSSGQQKAKIPPKVPPKPSSATSSSVHPEYANLKTSSMATATLQSSLDLTSPPRTPSNTSTLRKDEFRITPHHDQTKEHSQLSTISYHHLQPPQPFADPKQNSNVEKLKQELQLSLQRKNPREDRLPLNSVSTLPCQKSQDNFKQHEQPISLQNSIPNQHFEVIQSEFEIPRSVPPTSHDSLMSSSQPTNSTLNQNRPVDVREVQVLHTNSIDSFPSNEDNLTSIPMSSQDHSRKMVMVEVLRNNVREVGIDVGMDGRRSLKHQNGSDTSNSYQVTERSAPPLLRDQLDVNDSVQNMPNGTIFNGIQYGNPIVDDRFIVTLKNADDKDQHQGATETSPQKGKFKSLWNKFIYKDSDESMVSKSKPKKNDENRKKRLEIEKALLGISKPIQATLVKAGETKSNHCYDNPEFSATLDEVEAPVTQVEETTSGHNYLLKEGISPPSHYTDSNMKMKSTSSQTNINIHPITSIVQRKDSTASLRANPHGNSTSGGPITRSSSGYITTSGISPQAVVEVAKALRARMQEQQKQKEEKHRQTIETSSILYSNNQECSNETRDTSPCITSATSDYRDLLIAPNSQYLENSNYNSSIKYHPQKSDASFATSTEATTSFIDNGGISNRVNESFRNGTVRHSVTFSDGSFTRNSDRFSQKFDHSENNFSSLQVPDYFSESDTNGVGRDCTSLTNIQRSRSSNPYKNFASTTLPKAENKIVYAELAFPTNNTKTFKIFHPNDDGKANPAKNGTSYSTLSFPPPSPPPHTVTKYEEIHI